MVAYRGDGWVLAPSLVVLHEQINRRWSGRDRRSDGSIGDADHRARNSDHNPDSGGIVRALDTDEDVLGPAGGEDETALMVEALRASRDYRIKYLIYEGHIFSSYDSSGGSTTGPGRAWEWRTYSGVNAHARHWHLSIGGSARAAADTTPWVIERGSAMAHNHKPPAGTKPGWVSERELEEWFAVSQSDSGTELYTVYRYDFSWLWQRVWKPMARRIDALEAMIDRQQDQIDQLLNSIEHGGVPEHTHKAGGVKR